MDLFDSILFWNVCSILLPPTQFWQTFVGPIVVIRTLTLNNYPLNTKISHLYSLYCQRGRDGQCYQRGQKRQFVAFNILKMYLFLEKNYMLKELGKICPTNFWPMNVAKVGNTAKQKGVDRGCQILCFFFVGKTCRPANNTSPAVRSFVSPQMKTRSRCYLSKSFSCRCKFKG